jgi:Spy/CpxP family protein refolding chaperone
MNKLILSTLVSASFAAVAVPLVFAQTANPNPEGTRAQHFEHRGHHGQHAFRLPSERIEARLAYLKTAMKITDAQQPQWDAFAATLRKQAREGDERIKAHGSKMAQGHKNAPPTAVERMEFRQARLAAASARLSETLAAAKPLYASLTPEQQKVADEVLAPRGHGMFHRHGMHGRA